MMGVKFLILVCLGTSCLADDFFDPLKHNILWLKCKASDNYTQASNLKAEWMKEHEESGWYYVMGNKHHAATLAKSLTGKEPPDRSLDGSCFTNQRINSNEFKIMGYNGNIAQYSCDSKRSGKRECKPTNASTNEIWAANRGTTESTIVWTDNDKFALSYRCSGMYRVWSLRSTENVHVTKPMREKIKGIIKAEKFNVENLLEYPRNGCPDIE